MKHHFNLKSQKQCNGDIKTTLDFHEDQNSDIKNFLDNLKYCCIFYNITYSQHFLCEDRSTASESHFSYVDFLCHMHKVDYSETNPQFFPQFFSLFGNHLYTIFQEIRAMLS